MFVVFVTIFAVTIGMYTHPPKTLAQEIAKVSGTSPEGDSYTVGWELPVIPTPRSGFRNRSVQEYSLETRVLPDGLQTLIHLQNSDAPKRYVFPLHLPEGSSIVAFNENSVDAFGVLHQGEIIATIQKPWAYDAAGTPVSTALDIENGVLVQTIDHSPNLHFPITADPQITWGWEKTTIRLSKKETQVTGGATSAGALAALPWMAALGVSGPVGIAIILASARIAFDAIRAHRNGKCLGIVVGTNPASSNFGVSTFEFGC